MKNTATESFAPIIALSIIKKMQILMLVSDTSTQTEYTNPEVPQNTEPEISKSKKG